MKLFEFVSEHMVSHLLELAKDELDLDHLPKIELIGQPTVGNGTSFGEISQDGIKVAVFARHPMDVMRTLAHELVHWKQIQNQEHLDGSDGSGTENDANALAGVIMRKFGKMYPEYFLSSLPSHHTPDRR